MKSLSVFTILIMLAIYSVQLFANETTAISDKNYETVDCGILSKNNDIFKVVKQTSEIPFISKQKSPGYYFGCTIQKGTETFRAKALLKFPKPKILNVNVPNKVTDMDGYSFLTTETVTFTGGYGYIFMQLDETDSPGIYEVELFINDTSVKKVSFDVQLGI